MRGRPDDPDPFGDLYDRFRRPTDPPRGGGRWTRNLPPESSTRLIDAALGILGSVRTFIDVAEDLLLERRGGAPHAEEQRGPWVREERGAWMPRRDDDEGGGVRDIPLYGS